MKRTILTLLALLPMLAFGQIKKKTYVKPVNQVEKAKQPPTSPKQVINIEETVRNNAEKWFREVYVDKLFKDPYSYKLLKLTSERIDVKQSLLDSIVYLNSEIEKCNITEKNRTLESRGLWQAAYDKVFLDITKDENSLKNEKDEGQVEYWGKRIAIHKKYALQYLSTLRDYDLYFLNFNEKNRITQKLETISAAQGAILAFYSIKIDCYSKNSIGNEVLGRFQFPFTENGTIGLGNGLTTVVHLNKVD